MPRTNSDNHGRVVRRGADGALVYEDGYIYHPSQRSRTQPQESSDESDDSGDASSSDDDEGRGNRIDPVRREAHESVRSSQPASSASRAIPAGSAARVIPPSTQRTASKAREYTASTATPPRQNYMTSGGQSAKAVATARDVEPSTKRTPMIGSSANNPPSGRSQSYVAGPAPPSKLSKQPSNQQRVQENTAASSTNAKALQQTISRYRDHEKTDHVTGVTSIVRVGDPDEVTASDLKRQGFRVRKSIRGTGPLHQGDKHGKGKATIRYDESAHPRRDFRLGNVIEIQWAEPMDGATVITRQNDETGYTRTRRFIVVGESARFAAVVPIHTYYGRGIRNAGHRLSHHGIVYTGPRGQRPPRPQDNELMDVFNGEREVLRDPAIRVETTSPADRLDPNARINYASVYQLDQDNMSIYVYGRVDPNQLGQFLYNQQEVQRNLRSQATSLTAPSSGTNSQNPPPTTIPPTSGSYSSLQSQTSQQSHGRQAPGRQQSVSNTPARAPQPNQQTQPGPSTSRRAESSGADQRNIRNQAPSVSSITEQMSTLRIRARNYRVDLSRLSHEQQETLSRQPRENQSQYLLQMLRAQNPAVHAQVTQAIASRQNQRRPEEEDEDEDDSDEE